MQLLFQGLTASQPTGILQLVINRRNIGTHVGVYKFRFRQIYTLQVPINMVYKGLVLCIFIEFLKPLGVSTNSI